MRNILLFGLLVFGSLTARAQSDEDFENFGKTLLKEISDTNKFIHTRFIRIREYHRLIEEQPWSNNQQSIAMHRVNDDYSEMYMNYQRSMTELKDSYSMDREEGATFEYLRTEKELQDGASKIYTLRVNYLYRNGKVQTIVGLIMDTAWLGDEMVAISPVKEDF